MPEELAIIGSQARHIEWLRRIGDEQDFTVRSVLAFERVRQAASYDIDALLAEARQQLDAGQAAGVTTFWDFPSSCLAPILAEERGLPTPGLRATVCFEHKYWSRLIQQRVAPDDTPAFAVVDVFEDSVLDAPPLDYPFWLKPVKSYSGHLGFRVRNLDDYRHAVEQLRTGIRRLGEPFQDVLDRIDDVPDELAVVGGTGAVAEQIIDGDQCTLEGHVHDGQVDIHGIFDIHRGEDGSTFTHYIYPSRLPPDARAQMRSMATDLVKEVGYDHAAFNIEFFVDEPVGRVWILEVNPRISQEHSHLMDWVDDGQRGATPRGHRSRRAAAPGRAGHGGGLRSRLGAGGDRIGAGARAGRLAGPHRDPHDPHLRRVELLPRRDPRRLRRGAAGPRLQLVDRHRAPAGLRPAAWLTDAFRPRSWSVVRVRSDKTRWQAVRTFVRGRVTPAVLAVDAEVFVDVMQPELSGVG